MKNIFRKQFTGLQVIALLVGSMLGQAALSGAVTLTKTWISGETLTAADLNQNFADLKAAVDALEAQTLDARLTALETEVSAARGTQVDLVTRLDGADTTAATNTADIATNTTDIATNASNITTLQGDVVPGLGTYLSIDTTTTIDFLAPPHLIFSGANVHIQDGSGCTNGATDPPTCTTPVATGLGNLIVGYNENSGAVVTGDRAGNHNLVVGPDHEYTSFGGLVAGDTNIVSGPSASVVGGRGNTASGVGASILGGQSNAAGDIGNSTANTGQYATICGGNSNQVEGDWSAILGGQNNTTWDDYTAGVGGALNNIGDTFNGNSGTWSVVVGGSSNESAGLESVISGGTLNLTLGIDSVVAGGDTNSASTGTGGTACVVGYGTLLATFDNGDC